MTETDDDRQPTPDQYRKAAFDQHHRDGDCEIDHNAPVSVGDDPGAYVQAWVWVYDDDALNAPED